ncbi:protein mono-ADP-ribosyltransferase PARP9 [Acanthochromis polyacanthus]|uniref:protein mono-ADP-ribosyltransferase PARP9 n=1 Tax=Acanthochromis polyacanthus TaxID=80966 RepID=UPI0022344CF1|nr:protein mono-ADP-ribosyltransferase PARP9 [Acanthochromis polyacanthus]XP_051815035.1 protein mono-ADP-ribosyltransferase PARP9 [Acanthochromis polyacanthus]
MDSKLDIPLHGYSLNIVKRRGHGLSDILSCKFGCVATFEGVDFERDRSIASLTVAPEKRCTFSLPMGVQVSVWKADLTKFKVDAVVNAANSHLQHCGGLAQALSEAGGPRIQKECDDYVNKHGKLETGDAMISGAGTLQCNKIIHAVGPDLSKYPTKSEMSQAKSLLEKAIKSILNKVKENNLKTVAIPAISSGLFHYPLPECADTIVSTVKRYYQSSYSKGHRLKEIFFVNHDEPTVKEMERACHQILANQKPMSYSQATGSASRGPANTPPPTVQIGKVLLKLRKDKLEEQQTDIIVNTASPDGNLSSGRISGVLLQKAGDGMQKEMDKAHKNGQVIPTKSYKLPCKEVYHTFCIEKWHHKANEILFNSVLECLQRAAASRHKSIAFPAIGTGALGFTKPESARIMLDAVALFARSCQRMMEVHFVIFPYDDDTFQAFEEKIRSLQQHYSSASHHSPTSEMPRDDFHGSRAPSPQMSLTGLSEESTREAEKWLTDLFQSSGTVTICNNFIQHFSEEEYWQLTRLHKRGVSIEEFLAKGHACINISGDSREDVVMAALQVEAMLCTIQKKFVSEEESELQTLTANKVSFPKRTVLDYSSQEFSDRQPAFKNHWPRILKVEKVENSTLELLFDLKKKQLGTSTPQRMFQRIPAQFCEMVSQVGFHAECAPPEDPAYGDGIYFTSTVMAAMKTWKERNEEYLYFVEAEVLTGDSCPGKPGLILPPAKGKDPHILYDSVTGGTDVTVIFSGYQALPRYIITCKKR